MRCLLLSSCFLFLAGCSPLYKDFKTTTGNPAAILRFKPDFNVALYKARINVTGHYLSGLLLIKKMPDSSMRIVFSNEPGFKFFDFGFFKNDSFKIYSIIKKMNRKAVIKTLRKDFELVLMQPLDTAHASVCTRAQDNFLYYVFPQGKGYNYYITDSTGDVLLKMERASKTKKVVTVTTSNYKLGLPDSIDITHSNFNFSIGLTRIER